MKRGEISGYEFCNHERGECNDEFKQITPHDMCKLSKNINAVKSGVVKKITKIVPDCHSALSNQRYVPFIDDPFAVKSDNAENIKCYRN